MMSILRIPAFNDNYLWLIYNHERLCAVAIDPGDAQPIKEALNQYGISLSAILITHHHPDHIGGVEALLQAYPCPVYGPEHNAMPFITHKITDNDTLKLPCCDLEFQVMAVPGHTLTHVAYYARPMLFCGDTLFAGGCGRLFEGTAEQMHASLQKIMTLPDNTIIYCAHEYTMANLNFAVSVEPNNAFLQQRKKQVDELRRQNIPTIPSVLLQEKQTNPFLRSDSPEIIKNIHQRFNCNDITAVEVFRKTREWKNEF